ncbi:MAG: ABC transporter ATP-binding protein [Asgard group archaeon]|nr:ABC transporter ATP-binding protein [Asgard group archaeon]
MPTIKVTNLTKHFEDSIAIQDISFTLKDGELLTLLGPSGSGKTTLLRLIAGLIKPDEGKIFFDNQDISDIPTEERNIGFVFQSFALFPHLTVLENIAFGLKAKNRSREVIKKRLKELLKLTDLQDKADRYPRELSGGEQSRVALARALAPNPSLLLLDEPLSALDKNLKESLRWKIRRIQQEVSVSTIYVTHDQEEAMEISDRILILNKGRIIEKGTPRSLYLRPQKAFTAKFLGIVNVLKGSIKQKDERYYLETSFGSLLLPQNDFLEKKKTIAIAISPENIELSLEENESVNEFQAFIKTIKFGGPYTEIIVETDATSITLHKTSSNTAHKYRNGQSVYISFPRESIIFLQT